jgi:predicted nicotinamide N-methyase
MSVRRAQLLHRIRRRFDIVSEIHQIGALRLPFTRVVDPDRVLDEVAAEADRREKISGVRADGDELHLPYWAELWDSALGLAHWLARSPTHLPIDVLDLGCGMGFAGAAAAALGHRVTLVDLERDALLFARLNTLESAPRVHVRRLNWQKERIVERFDLILGADVVYERKQWEYLERFWREHLKSDGHIVVAEPGRQSGGMFLDWIQSLRWTVIEDELRLSERARTIRIFKMTKPTD